MALDFLKSSSHKKASKDMPAQGVGNEVSAVADPASTSISGDDPTIDTEDPFSTSGHIGPKIIHDPKNATFDLILVHGLTGNRETTWKHKTSKLSLAEYLAADFPTARVMVYGYDANVLNFWHFWVMANGAGVQGFGVDLASSISGCRPVEGAAAVPADRPMFFLGHSLGGLVIEQALLTAMNGNPTLRPLVEATKGVLFLGVPHDGSGLAKYASLIAHCLANDSAPPPPEGGGG